MSATATTPTAPSFTRFSCAFFFATRLPTFQVAQPSAAFLRVYMSVLCPGHDCANHQDGPDHADRDPLPTLLAGTALHDPPRKVVDAPARQPVVPGPPSHGSASLSRRPFATAGSRVR